MITPRIGPTSWGNGPESMANSKVMTMPDTTPEREADSEDAAPKAEHLRPYLAISPHVRPVANDQRHACSDRHGGKGICITAAIAQCQRERSSKVVWLISRPLGMGRPRSGLRDWGMPQHSTCGLEFAVMSEVP